MKSLTYYLTLGVIRLKGVKTIFSQDPIDYKKLRKENIHEISTFRRGSTKKFRVRETMITVLEPEATNSELVIYIPGGAFVYGPVQYHWDSVKKIATTTKNTTWLVDYPKAPENKIDVISENIQAVYKKALESYPSKKVILVGDSVGGTLIAALVQDLLLEKEELPRKIILISPVMNAHLSNGYSTELDKKDPILSKKGFTSAKKMAAIEDNLEDPQVSPIHKKFEGFPPTVLFLAENDITFPDQQVALEKMKAAGVEVKAILGKEMPHIWPILPVMSEGKVAFKKLLQEINSEVED